MSRSFGDGLASEVGVSAIPDCREVELTKDDKIIVLASDGIWEFLTNEEVSNIVYPHFLKGNAEKASEALVKHASQRWKSHETSSIDDITCVIIFLSV